MLERICLFDLVYVFFVIKILVGLFLDIIMVVDMFKCVIIDIWVYIGVVLFDIICGFMVLCIEGGFYVVFVNGV